ncbi:MAG: hypothetical protein IKG42_03525 [Clostridia bacterium]|nr:hypothetical protein [Clostridia bacterium]
MKIGYNGYKVKLNDIDGFVEKILFLWNNDEIAKEIGKNAKVDYEKKYMPDDNYNQLIRIYNECLGKE